MALLQPEEPKKKRGERVAAKYLRVLEVFVVKANALLACQFRWYRCVDIAIVAANVVGACWWLNGCRLLGCWLL